MKKSVGNLQIEIGDNGVDIPEEIAHNIFEPFFRDDKSRYEDGGSGLGLAITQKIMELHKGTLSLDLKPERGKKVYPNFTFTLINEETLSI